MILIDSSAWIEFLRERGDLYVKRAVHQIVIRDKALLCGPVRLEVLGGAKKTQRKRLSSDFDDLRYVGTGDYLWQEAISLSQRLRDAGFSLPWNDILIATIAQRAQVPVYSIDKHFDTMSRHLGLALYKPSYNGSFNSDY